MRVGVEEAWPLAPVGLEEKDLLETYQMQLTLCSGEPRANNTPQPTRGVRPT